MQNMGVLHLEAIAVIAHQQYGGVGMICAWTISHCSLAHCKPYVCFALFENMTRRQTCPQYTNKGTAEV